MEPEDVAMRVFDQSSSDDEDDAPPLVPLQPTHAPLDATAGAPQPSSLPSSTADTAIPATGPLQPVPVLLLTGYLGAGKTTLVNYILSAKHGYRCAVLLNEIADSADIEKALVREPEGDEPAPLADWVQLENGCICCSVKNDMVQALEALLRQRDRFDYVIIETTGLANPGPVAAALWTDPEMESSICLDAIVTVVDARNIKRHLYEERPGGGVNEAQQQVAFADVVLLNKIDLVSEEEAEAVEAELAAVNAEAAVLRCERCVIDLGRVLHTGMYSGDATAASEREKEEKEEAAAGGHVHGHHHDHHGHGDGHCSGEGCSHPAHASAHDPRVKTVTLHAPRPLDLGRLRSWLDELLWERERAEAAKILAQDGNAGDGEVSMENNEEEVPLPDIFRVKGLLRVAGSENKWVLQAVHELYDVVEGPAWEEGAGSRSKIVFIGRHLDGQRLQEGLEACCADD